MVSGWLPLFSQDIQHWILAQHTSFPWSKNERETDLHPFSQSTMLFFPQQLFCLESFFLCFLSLYSLSHVLSVPALSFKDPHFVNDYETPALVKEGPYPCINEFQTDLACIHHFFFLINKQKYTTITKWAFLQLFSPVPSCMRQK